MPVLNWLRGLFLVLCLGAATACGGAQAVRETATPAAENAYRLGPGDQLRIIVFGEQQLTGEFLVNAAGDISYPLVGAVQASGLTVDEFADRLRTVLRNGYVRQPNVAVEVMNYRPFFILGEVSRPGTYPYVANLTIENAVAIAEGYSYRADRRRVFIKRAGEDEEQEIRLPSTVRVQPGDTVRIAERRF